ncbi:TRAP transporter substrate-binding protein [Neotabrizicola sp. VNH66]|uniref:TRAP transporter substrate-binding protein n=1 Tax=Neotabrizicola sp. VNH66 TaxID=3400918 RepID=UPI003BFEDB5D
MTHSAFRFTTGIALAFSLTLGLTGPALAEITLTLGHGGAPGNPRTLGADEFARLVHERSNGEMTIKVIGAEQLGGDTSMLTSLRTGALNFTVNSQGASSGLVPEMAALGLPYVFEDSAAAFKVLDGPIGDQLSEKFSALGIEVLDWWDNGMRHTTNSKKPITTPADLAGMKIRTPADPMLVDIFESFGASTQQIAFGELYIALQQGVVDGQENPLANISSNKLYEVNGFVSLTGHDWQSAPFLMSAMTAAQLTPEQLEIIRTAAKDAGDLQRKLFAESDAKVLAEFEANPAIAVNTVETEAFRAATQPVIEKWKSGPIGAFVTDLLAAAQPN